MSIQQDYTHCENIIKHHSASFYKAFKILPLSKRNAIYAIYAFCRMADDAVDIHHDRHALDLLYQQLQDFNHGNIPDTPVFRALSHVFQSFDCDTQPYFHMLEGQYLDLDFKTPLSMDEFNQYCYYVAGTVGLMLLPIIATKNQDQLREVALSLGSAMQITNILRDIGEDLKINRIYIPKEVMDKHDVKDFSSGVTAEFVKMWEYMAQIAESQYKHLSQHLHLFDQDSQKALLRSKLFYQGILNAVRKNHYDCLNQRAYLSSWEKMKLLLKSNYQ